MFIKTAKFVLLINPKIYAISYIGFIVVMAMVFDYMQVPKVPFLSDKDGFLNTYFMTIIYVYVILLLTPFVFCVHLTLDCGYFQRLVLPAVRSMVFIILETIVSDYIINGLSEIVGTCEAHPEYANEKITCTSSSAEWIPLDISGHVYHVFYSMLIIIEECKYYKKWEQLGREMEVKKTVVDEDHGQPTPPPKLYTLFSTFVKIDFALLGILMIALHLTILNTIVYHHTIFEMAAAAVLAASLWFVTYRVIFALFETDDSQKEEFLLQLYESTTLL